MAIDKDQIASNLANIMDLVSVCEGLICAKKDGEVIVGQTLGELDHKDIVKHVLTILNNHMDSVKKGVVTDLVIGLEKGSIIVSKNEELIYIGILGEDGVASSGLLRRQLSNLAKL